jgi:hypothetical protein
MTKKEEYKQKRAQLRAISQAAKALVQAGAFDSINDAVVETYKTEEHQEFKSFIGWKSEGFKVKKGSKGFPIWGKPVKGANDEQQDQNQEQPGQEKNEKFWPLAYLFSNAQVEKIEQ